MDTKISNMTSATAMSNSDVLPIVQSGANFKVTKALVLTADSGEPISIQGASSSYIKIDATGTITITPASGHGVTIEGTTSPNTNNTYDIGTTSLRWKNLWSYNIYAANGLLADGAGVYMTQTSGTPSWTPTAAGGFAFDPSTNIFYVWNGTAWVSTTLS